MPEQPDSDRSQQLVTDFFEGYSRRFDSIYQEEDKSSWNRFLDRFVRASMFRRFEVAVEVFRESEVRSVLDVGCGPGNQALAMAEAMNYNVEGVDVAQSMIDIAQRRAEEHGVAERCHFAVADFMQYEPTSRCDAALSLGVVEYIENPAPFIRRMLDKVGKVVAFSVPVERHWLTPQRKVRYRLRNCPLWFYDEAKIHKMMADVGGNQCEIRRVDRDYIVVARPDPE